MLLYFINGTNCIICKVIFRYFILWFYFKFTVSFLLHVTQLKSVSLRIKRICYVMLSNLCPVILFASFLGHWSVKYKGSTRVIVPNFVPIGQTVAEIPRCLDFSVWHWNRDRNVAIFRIIKMAAAAILDFWNYKFMWTQNVDVNVNVNVERVMSVELRHHAKCRGDRSNPCRDIAIFYFSRWRPPPSRIFEITNF